VSNGNAGLSESPCEAIRLRRFVQQNDVDIVPCAPQANRVADENLISTTDWPEEVTLTKSNPHN
jgi:hypothetical protein